MTGPGPLRHLLYIGRFKLPEGNAATHRVLAVAKILRDLGVRVSLVGLAQDARSAGRMEVDGFDALAVSEATARDRLSGALSSRWLAEGLGALGPADGAIFYNFSTPALLASARQLAKRDMVALADCTEWYSPWGWRSVGDAVRAADSQVRNAILLPRLDGVISISEWLTKYYEQRVNTVRLPPLVDVEEPKWQVPHRPGPGDLRLVYAGDPGARKDALHSVIAAIAELQGEIDVRLDVFGPTRQQYAALHPSLERDLPDGVAFRGRVSQRDVLAAVAGADYSVFPRPHTHQNVAGSPTKLVEAATLGTGVITTNLGDAAHLSDLPGMVLVEDSEPTTLVNALRVAHDRRFEVPHTLDDRFDYRRWSGGVADFLARARTGTAKGSVNLH